MYPALSAQSSVWFVYLTLIVGPKCFKLFPLSFDLVYDNKVIPRDFVQQYAQIMADEEDELEEIRDRIRLIKVEKEPAI